MEEISKRLITKNNIIAAFVVIITGIILCVEYSDNNKIAEFYPSNQDGSLQPAITHQGLENITSSRYVEFNYKVEENSTITVSWWMWYDGNIIASASSGRNLYPQDVKAYEYQVKVDCNNRIRILNQLNHP